MQHARRKNARNILKQVNCNNRNHFRFINFIAIVFYGILHIGFGWLTINIFGAASDGHAQICDFWSPCDLYVRVLADNKEICRTGVQRDEMSVDMFKTCVSHKISKTAKIQFELWDKDVSDDDCLDRWTRSVHMKSENLRYGHSVVGVNAVWKDEYLEDWA